MPPGERGPQSPHRDRAEPGAGAPGRDRGASPSPGPGCILETVVSPFHCLYQDALEFHKQAHLRLPRSEAEASRLARAAVLLYVGAAEALVHQAVVELGGPEPAALLCDPGRPLPLLDVVRLLPAVVSEAGPGRIDPGTPPWPQFAELLALRADWAYPGPESRRRAYYLRREGDEPSFEPLEPHQAPAELRISADRLVYPLTGLPRDPYALRPRHLDTARGVLDSAVEALDRRLGGALTREGRHRREPVRMIPPG